MSDKMKLRIFERISLLVYVAAWIVLALDGTRLWALGVGFVSAVSWFVFGVMADIRE